MSDVDMFQFIEQGMRGGVSYIAKRHSKANNKYMKDYDETKKSKSIIYLDANNLYGWAMSQYLPTGDFKWKYGVELNELDDFKENGNLGSIWKVDIEYPEELHDSHNDYPLAPEKMMVKNKFLSDYSKKIKNKFNITSGNVMKLIPNLRKKEGYVVHYRNLQQYIKLGLKVTKVHKILTFKQSPWMKEYIDFNTNKRREAKNDFEKDFFKLMNNAVFGKTMENLRKRVDVKLVNNEKKLMKWIARPTYVSSKIFNENLMAIHKIKEKLVLNRPSYVGMCILDLSKVLMYDFHYNYIKNKYGDDAKLLFTDTDSLTYEIEGHDIYEDFWRDKVMFDFSGYPRNSPFFDDSNKKVIGKFKDESGGVPIVEFVGLRSKMYSYLKDGGNCEKTAKGVKKNVIKNVLKHDDYKKTLFNQGQMRHKMKTIRSTSHQLGTYELNKISLSCFDDNRYLKDGGIESYACGHWRIV